MPAATIANDLDRWETDRLAALQRFDVLDSPREEAFDRITRLIRSIFDVPLAIVSMFDGHRQWYKSIDGAGAREVPRGESFCKLPVLSGVPLIVPDALNDPRFADHPNVTSGLKVRFYAGMPLRTSDGQVIGTLCAIDTKPREFATRDIKILEDLSRIAMSELELRDRASIDVLTGSLSRRAFKEEGARSIALARRYGHPLSAAIFDLDYFKMVNDQFGHPAGDRVLADSVKACATHLRQSDLIGRLGGEEFVILLPYTSLKSALEVAEKLRSSIEQLTFEFSGAGKTVTASFGVAALDEGVADIDALLENADKALYEAKRTGRNRSVAYTSPSAQPEVTVAPPTLMSERSVARRVLKAGQIQFNNAQSAIDCTVRSLASDRAGIDLSTTFGIPARFTLAIRGDGFTASCRVIRQTDKHLEVEFCEAA